MIRIRKKTYISSSTIIFKIVSETMSLAFFHSSDNITFTEIVGRRYFTYLYVFFLSNLWNISVVDVSYYTVVVSKVWGKKKCTSVCVYYKNYARFRQKSIKSAKSTHPENSKLVRQVHVVQKVPPGSMIEQKNGFCENTIFVKNYLQKKVHLHLWISCKIC